MSPPDGSADQARPDPEGRPAQHRGSADALHTEQRNQPVQKHRTEEHARHEQPERPRASRRRVFPLPFGSVRVATTLGAVAVVAVALLAACAGLLGVIHQGLVNSAERTALARADAVARVSGSGRLVDRLAVPDGEDSLLQVVADDGRILAASENLAGRAPVASFEPAAGHSSAARSLDLALRPDPHPHPYRLVAVRAKTANGSGATVYAGTSLETARYTQRLIVTSMIPGIPLLLLLVAAVTWRSTGRALRPVEAIRAEVAEITERDLGRRVPVPASRDEVARLSQTMNATLDRLEESMDRQRRFVADASHELRNPIAALRAHVEVAIAHPQLLHGPELLDDVIRVQQLADDLLLLARLDAGQSPERTNLDLCDLVRTTTARRPRGGFRSRSTPRVQPRCTATAASWPASWTTSSTTPSGTPVRRSP
ncbi:histidine kinase dimerization/phospho-acceptor domain-containing protein [Streptomyces xanthochromogenes]|uniref:histidine kinase dimerization/phospho-acceptor domain-containing protein n=1 Tax=Streptomyces xanthochromogenes TaxID=67384 RepID=UPI003426139F